MYQEDLTLNNQQWLICHKTQPNQIISGGRIVGWIPFPRVLALCEIYNDIQPCRLNMNEEIKIKSLRLTIYLQNMFCLYCFIRFQVIVFLK